MTEAVKVPVPLLNPNEPEAVIAVLHVADGQSVNAGDVLCELETTKSVEEVHATVGGWVVGLSRQQGDVVRAGDSLCWIASAPDWSPPVEHSPDAAPAGDLPDGLRITQPALALARSLGVDLNVLPKGPLVTGDRVRAHSGNGAGQPSPVAVGAARMDPQAIVIFGGGGHGKTLIDLLRTGAGWHVVGIIDDALARDVEVLGVPVLGDGRMLTELWERGWRQAANAVGGIGNVSSRIAVFDRLSEAGFSCPTLVHPTAVVEPSALVGPGCQVLAGSYVGSDARIAVGALVNTNAVISHDCSLGEYVNVSPGALVAGGVAVGDRALIGMGVTINLNTTIGPDAKLGNGAVIKGDVPPGGVVRAGTTWPR